MTTYDVLVSTEILEFFNKPLLDPYDIMSRIDDDPNFGDPSGKGISYSLAQNIISFRNTNHGGSFQYIQQIADVPGIGQDTLHDILYSFQKHAIPPGNVSIEGNLQVGGSYQREEELLHVNGSARIAGITSFGNTGRATTGGGTFGLGTVGGNTPLKIYTGDRERVVVTPEGNVGIGTTEPSSQLEVQQLGGTLGLVTFRDASTNAGFKFDVNDREDSLDYGAPFRHGIRTGTGESLLFRVGADNDIVFDGGGNVGIGTTSPKGKLEVVGETLINGNFRVNGTTYSGNTHIRSAPGAWLELEDTRPGGATMRLVAADQFGYIGLDGDLPFRIATNSQSRFVIDGSGNVGIGTMVPNAKLAVNGKITAEEVEVMVDVPDYVFHDDYTLMPLDKLQAYTQENKHLPNIPSAGEAAANGVNLGEMQAKLLEKIEELTLYVIQLREENQNLGERINALEANV